MKNNQKILLFVVLIVIIVIVGYFVLSKKAVKQNYQTYAECIAKTGLPCTFNFVGDLGHEWLPSSFSTQQECENAISQVGRTCLIPPGNFSEVRWISASDLSAGQKDNPATTTKDETANWKTYTNTQDGFEFKYPENLISQEKSGIDGTGVEYFFVEVNTKENTEFKCDGCDGPNTFFTVHRFKPKDVSEVSCSPEYEIRKVSVSGIMGNKCVVNDALNGPLLLIYLTKDGTTYYQIQADNYEATRTTLIDQILSTFKFTK